MNGGSRAAIACAFTTLLLLGSACSASRYPAETAEGLVRVGGHGFDAVYRDPSRGRVVVRPVRVEPCTVEFRENWLRDQNRERDVVNRVEAEDMRRIADDLGAVCTEIFETALAPGDGSGVSGPDAKPVILKPRITELDVTAPDILSPSGEREYVRTAARMTLTVDIVDTSEVLLERVVDHRSTPETSSVTRSTRHANLVEMERLLEQWASMLAAHLEKADF